MIGIISGIQSRVLGSSSPPPAWSDDYSFQFDGSTQFFDVPHDPVMNITTNLTVCAWVKPIVQDPPVDGWIIDKYALSASRGYGLLHDDFGTGAGGGRWCFQLGDISSSPHRLRSTSAPQSNTWVLLVGTFDSVSGDAKLYINGALDNTLNIGAGNTLHTNSVDLNLGASSPTPSLCYEGLGDEISIWNCTMDLAEVQEVWGTGVPNDLGSHSQASNGVLWYRMGEGAVWNGTNWVMPNSFAGSNDATSHSMLQTDRVTTVP
jgi:hypothetical protein